MIKDSPDSPEPLNKKPRLATEEVQPPERAKGTYPHPTSLLNSGINLCLCGFIMILKNLRALMVSRYEPIPVDDFSQALLHLFILFFISPSLVGPVSLLSLWTNRITTANSRKHQEFVGRVSSVNNKFELYQHLKDENGCVI